MQQVRKRLARNIETASGVGQRDEHGMARGAGIRQVELVFPFIELGRIMFFVGKIVGHTRVSVDRVHVLAHLARHKPRRDGEIFIVRSRQTRAELVGLGKRGIGFRHRRWNSGRRAAPIRAKPRIVGAFDVHVTALRQGLV